jgi:branched-chain amino acid transport system substrate-binding protein
MYKNMEQTNDYNVNNEINNESQLDQNLDQNKKKKSFKKIFFVVALLFILGAGFYYFGAEGYDTRERGDVEKSIYLFGNLDRNEKEIWPNLDHDNPFVIGLVMSDISYMGYRATLFLAQQTINRNGGVNGRVIQFVKKDGLCSREGGAEAAKSLINDFGANALLGGQCSDEFLGSAPIIQEAGLLSFSPSATNPDISKLGKNIFRTAVSDEVTGAYAAKFARDVLKSETAILIIQNKTYPLGLAEHFNEEFVISGGEILDKIEFSIEDDFTKYIDDIKSLNPDIIYLVSQWSDLTVDLITEIKAAGITSNILSSEVIFERPVLENNNGNLDGVYGVKIFIDENNPKYLKFIENTQTTKLDHLFGYSLGLYDIIFLIKESYEAGGGNPDLAADYLYNLDNWNGAIGSISFNKRGDVNLPLGAYKIVGEDIELIDKN